MTLPRRTVLACAVALMACARNPVPARAQQDAPGAVIPPGFGTLRQSDLQLTLSTDQLEVRFLPLDPRVFNLLAPDAYQSLSALLEGRRAQIDSVARSVGVSQPGIALVSFFGLQANANYDAEVLTMVVRNRLIRPIGIVPYSPGFMEQRLEVRQQRTAFYLFEEEIPVFEPFSIQYYAASSEDWGRRLPVIDRERQRVSLRAAKASAEAQQKP